MNSALTSTALFFSSLALTFAAPPVSYSWEQLSGDAMFGNQAYFDASFAVDNGSQILGASASAGDTLVVFGSAVDLVQASAFFEINYDNSGQLAMTFDLFGDTVAEFYHGDFSYSWQSEFDPIVDTTIEAETTILLYAIPVTISGGASFEVTPKAEVEVGFGNTGLKAGPQVDIAATASAGVGIGWLADAGVRGKIDLYSQEISAEANFGPVQGTNLQDWLLSVDVNSDVSTANGEFLLYLDIGIIGAGWEGTLATFDGVSLPTENLYHREWQFSSSSP